MTGGVVVAGRRPLRSVNQDIRSALRADAHVTLEEPLSRHNLGVALTSPGRLTIAGNAGHYGGALNDGADIHVTHGAGWGVGEGMSSGRILVSGRAGMSAGAAMHGGVLDVRGDAGPRCGARMRGGTIIVHGDAGYAAGLQAHAGRVVCLGDAGPQAGAGIGRAQLWVAGRVLGTGAGAAIVEPTAADRAALGAALAPLGIDSDRRWTVVAAASPFGAQRGPT